MVAGAAAFRLQTFASSRRLRAVSKTMRFGRSLLHLGLGVVVIATPWLSAAEPAQRASKGVDEASPLTAPPLATPPLRWRIDVARLARGVTQGTNVSFDASLDEVVRT